MCVAQGHKNNRWVAWDQFVELVKDAGRVYAMSAQAGIKPAAEDTVAKLLFQAGRSDEGGKAQDCKWQMNSAKPLRDTKYSFIYTDHNEMALQEISDRLRGGASHHQLLLLNHYEACQQLANLPQLDGTVSHCIWL